MRQREKRDETLQKFDEAFLLRRLRSQRESSFPMTTTQILQTKRELAILTSEGKHFEVTTKSKDYPIRQTAAISVDTLCGFPTKTHPFYSYSEKQPALKTESSFKRGQGKCNGWEALEFCFNERFVVHTVGNPDRLEAHLPTK